MNGCGKKVVRYIEQNAGMLGKVMVTNINNCGNRDFRCDECVNNKEVEQK